MSARRGLTLVEVLAAIALMTILATAVAPVLRSATAIPPQPDFDLVDLSLLADDVLLRQGVPEAATVMVDWKYRPGVTVRTLPGANGTWIGFSCSDLHVFRWVEKP